MGTRVRTTIIRDEGCSFAPLAQHWDRLVEQVYEVVRVGGWRALWEGEWAKACLCMRAEAEQAYDQVTAWVPENDGQAVFRRCLLADLCTYERAFYNWAVAIEQWPEMSSGLADPSLSKLAEVEVTPNPVRPS
jgi:hypothetical protein